MVTQRLANKELNLDLNIDLCNWIQREELLYKGSVLYIPEVEALCMEILKKHHDDPLAGHVATKKTYNTLRYKYFWPNRNKQVEAYCTSFLICQGAIVIRGKQAGKLQPLPIPMKVWDVFSMDVITWLQESVTYGGTNYAIPVVVDKLSKIYHYIACFSNMTARKLDKVTKQEVIRLHGVIWAIISDRGTLFTSKLWVNLMYSFRIERQLTTAFHPQTNWQRERLNSHLEQYLRSYVNYHKDVWSSSLALAEFAYNTSVPSSTGRALFEIVYGEISDMLTFDEVQKYNATWGSSAEEKSLMEKKRVTRKEVKKSLANDQAYQVYTYNKSHCDVAYNVSHKF